MANLHAVVRTDKMTGTDDRSDIVSVRYQPSSTKTAIENGNVVLLNGLEANQREVYVGETPAKDSALKDIVLIATPEVVYDGIRGLDQFTNEAGKIARGYRLVEHDIFSVTEEALANASPAVGQIIELKAGTKLNNVASATSGATPIGKIIDKNVVGAYTFYAIEVG